MWDALRTTPSLATLFPGLPVGETAGWRVIRLSPNLSEPHIVEVGPLFWRSRPGRLSYGFDTNEATRPVPVLALCQRYPARSPSLPRQRRQTRTPHPGRGDMAWPHPRHSSGTDAHKPEKGTSGQSTHGAWLATWPTPYTSRRGAASTSKPSELSNHSWRAPVLSSG
ncbi:hypothetical protein BGZ61DRAFT_133653 [Ilyonectria robusta]|uniref:uncharacterized protein n=1 Tax=Ilyonectria robusta TaxID=1079257 RepID=UPI001E8E2CAF|nr:uncharacterized protein BGZ61DRAFT_133653 [Ilyonectria robusta]KAH8735009.1 hypothetical protein BGZ61DRAFT_133653 [Ilyonectria robusta]